MQLFDTHAHYNDSKFDIDREEVINKVYNSGVTKLVNAGYSLESSKVALEIAQKYDWMYVICGISPNDIPDDIQDIDNQILDIEKMLNENVEDVETATKKSSKTANKVVAIGEIGLDYHWNKENKELQKLAFIKQIELANELKLPIVIHSRKAAEDTIQVLKQHEVVCKGVFHCCSLKDELLKEALKLGFYISFAGPITFKNSKNVEDVINLVPNDRILIETDSPYLSPEPLRGSRNDPRNVKYVAQKIAQIKNVSLEEIAKITYQNAEKIYEV